MTPWLQQIEKVRTALRKKSGKCCMKQAIAISLWTCLRFSKVKDPQTQLWKQRKPQRMHPKPTSHQSKAWSVKYWASTKRYPVSSLETHSDFFPVWSKFTKIKSRICLCCHCAPGKGQTLPAACSPTTSFQHPSHNHNPLGSLEMRQKA